MKTEKNTTTFIMSRSLNISSNDEIPSNITINTHISSYEKNKLMFWCFAFICISIAVVAMIGNGIVVLVSYKNRHTTRLQHLNSIVRSLAVTDFLFGLLGTPLIIVNFYVGKYFVLIVTNKTLIL